MPGSAILTTVLLFVFAFLCGSIPFSVWLSRAVAGRDVRAYGDGTPGAVNAFKAGSWKAGLPALLLDISKGIIPAHLAYDDFGLRGWPVVLVALAPVIGHIFSPFLKFAGGKGIATAFGVWIGLNFWPIPVVAVGGVLIGLALFKSSAWPVILGLSVLLIYFVLIDPNPIYLGIWAGQFLLIGWKLRRDLAHRPALRPRLLARG